MFSKQIIRSKSSCISCASFFCCLAVKLSICISFTCEIQYQQTQAEILCDFLTNFSAHFFQMRISYKLKLPIAKMGFAP